jgi:PAS domain S-box-containing protein
MKSPRSTRNSSDQGTSRRGRLLVFFGPILAAGIVTVSLSALAGLFGWHAELMLSMSGVAGALLLCLVVGLFSWQIYERSETQNALHNVEARVGSIMDSAMDAIVSCDDQSRIVLFNSAAERVFGYKVADIKGQPLDLLMPARFRERHGEHISRFGKTGQTSRRMGDQTVLWGIRSTGEEFPIEASISHLSETGRKFYTVILRDITERFRAEEALRRSREQLRKLAAAAHLVREQEKSRIARELHDELGQALTALKIDLGWIESRLSSDDKGILEKLHSMTNVLDHTVAATRRISADLRPLMLDDLGLLPAAEWLAQNFSERTGIPCEFACNVSELSLESEQATAVFRMLQESLTNAARHSHATQVEVNIFREGNDVTLTVRDNGMGFSLDRDRKIDSFGLLGIEERAYLLGGQVHITSAPGAGTEIEIRIPTTGSAE